MTRHVLTRALLALAVLALSGALQSAEAQVGDDVSLMVKILVDPSIGGTAIGAASGTVDGLPVSIDRASWADTHSRRSPLFEAALGIRAGDVADIVGMFSYGRAGGNADTIGEVGGVPLQASFDDYQSWGLEGGVRLRGFSGVGPYAVVTGGFRHVSAITARLLAGSDPSEVTVYNASTVPSLSAAAGMLWGSRGFAVGGEVGVRYAGAPSSPTGQAIKPASGAGSRWSLPFGLVLQF